MRLPLCKTFAACLGARQLDWKKLCCEGWLGFTRIVTLDAELVALDRFVDQHCGTSQPDFKARRFGYFSTPTTSTNTALTTTPVLCRRVKCGRSGASGSSDDS